MPIGRAIRIIIELLIIVFCVLALIHEHHSYTPKEKPSLILPE